MHENSWDEARYLYFVLLPVWAWNHAGVSQDRVSLLRSLLDESSHPMQSPDGDHMKPPNPYPVILNLLNRGVWYVPHEVQLQLRLVGCHVSPESTTARIRDLRKPRYGRHRVEKRIRQGTNYYEYAVINQDQQAA